MQLQTPRFTSIVLNGERIETAARTLADLIAGQGFAQTAVATAVNGAFVPREARGRNGAVQRRQGRDRGTAPGRLINSGP